MKKLIILMMTAVLLIGLVACSDTAGLTEADATKVLEVLSTAATDSFDTSASRALIDVESKAGFTASFTNTQEDGGIAVLTYRAEKLEGVENVETATGGFDAVFTNFVVTHTDESDVETEYTLNGSVYFECSFSSGTADEGYDYSFDYEFLFYTDADDDLSIEGDGLNTQLEVAVRNTVRNQYNITTTGMTYRISYDCTGTVNGVAMNSKTGFYTGSFSYNLAL